ncbi:MAG: GntR family transcriptional regulator [Alloprevotella sp.]
MIFKDSQPIYVQIAERLCDEILSGNYAPDSRVPGVREYSALLEVNANTTVKSYDLLAQRGIIYSKRGMGYFVSPEAAQLILEARRARFRSHTLPDFIRELHQLQISFAEVEQCFRETLAKPTADAAQQ